MNISILNVGEGDLKITYNPSSKKERELAKKTVRELLKQGFALFVQVGDNEKGPMYQRVKAFDPDSYEYIVFGEPPNESPAAKPAPKRATTARAVATRPVIAVARTAGGFDPFIPSRIVKGGDAHQANANLQELAS